MRKPFRVFFKIGEKPLFMIVDSEGIETPEQAGNYVRSKLTILKTEEITPAEMRAEKVEDVHGKFEEFSKAMDKVSEKISEAFNDFEQRMQKGTSKFAEGFSEIFSSSKSDKDKTGANSK